MKVIFLDFDGVLNSETSFLYEDYRRKVHKEQGVKGKVCETLSNENCAALQSVLNQFPDVKIVLSTTWRCLFPMDWLKAKLEEYHVDSSRVIDKTPEIFSGQRGREIQDWLDAHKEVTQYVIIDDNDWGITDVHGTEWFIQTTWASGMNVDHARDMMDRLSKWYKKKVEDAKVAARQKGP